MDHASSEPHAAPTEQFSAPHNPVGDGLPPPLAIPPPIPPLMPLSSCRQPRRPLQWSCPDECRMLVAHVEQPCPPCHAFLEHTEAALSDPQYIEAHEEGRARQQSRYYTYLEQHFAFAGGQATCGLDEQVRELRSQQQILMTKLSEQESTFRAQLQVAHDARDLYRQEAENLRTRVARLEEEAQSQSPADRAAQGDPSVATTTRSRPTSPPNPPRSPPILHTPPRHEPAPPPRKQLSPLPDRRGPPPSQIFSPRRPSPIPAFARPGWRPAHGPNYRSSSREPPPRRQHHERSRSP
ncbi:hypothetical protein K466DRAFT_607946, partial [Polyporus arcularius HHB13444]